jgi:hypothetical protein
MKCPGEPDFKLKPHKVIRNMLSDLKLKCRNEPYGCKQIINYEKLEIHEEVDCQFEKVNCPNIDVGCKAKMSRDVLDLHIKEKCEF